MGVNISGYQDKKIVSFSEIIVRVANVVAHHEKLLTQ